MAWCGGLRQGVYRHPMSRRSTPGWVKPVAAGLLAAALALVLGACSGDKDPGPTADDTTTKPATSSTIAPEKLPTGHFIKVTYQSEVTPEERDAIESYRNGL